MRGNQNGNQKCTDFEKSEIRKAPFYKGLRISNFRARDGTRIYLLPEAPCFQGVQAHLIVGNQKGNQRSWDMFNIQITLPSLQSVLIAVNFSFSILTL